MNQLLTKQTDTHKQTCYYQHFNTGLDKPLCAIEAYCTHAENEGNTKFCTRTQNSVFDKLIGA